MPAYFEGKLVSITLLPPGSQKWPQAGMDYEIMRTLVMRRTESACTKSMSIRRCGVYYSPCLSITIN